MVFFLEQLLNGLNFPIQDFYISRIVRGDDGVMRNELVTRIFEAKADSNHDECAMN